MANGYIRPSGNALHSSNARREYTFGSSSHSSNRLGSLLPLILSVSSVLRADRPARLAAVLSIVHKIATTQFIRLTRASQPTARLHPYPTQNSAAAGH